MEQFSEKDHAEVAALQELFDAGKITGNFASSVLRQYTDKNFLSEKQMFYVRKLVAEGTGTRENVTEAAAGGSARNGVTETVNAEKIQQLFRAALKADVQYPHIQYPVDGTHDESHIRVFLADNHKDIIFISVASRQRYAWIDALRSQLHVKLGAAIGNPVYKQIRRIIDDPVGEAVIHGKQTGRCMFCARRLDNEFSVNHGYGPICAGNYGLPWLGEGAGSKKVSIDAADLLASLDDVNAEINSIKQEQQK